MPLTLCTAMLAAASWSRAQSEIPNLNEIRNWVSSTAHYQALAELCTGKSHPEVGVQVGAQVDRLYHQQAESLTALYEKRYARFQKIKKCPEREFGASRARFEAELAALSAIEPATPAPAPESNARTVTAERTPARTGSGGTSSAVAESPAASADELYQQGIANFLSPRRAVDLFSQVIAKEPGDIQGYRARAWAHLANNDPGRALTDFDHVLRIDPDDSEAYRGRGWARFELGRYQQAKADFGESITRARNPAEGFAGRGFASFFLGEPSIARVDFRSTMRYQPDFNDAETYTRSGELLARPATAERGSETYDPRARKARRRDPRFAGDVSTRLDDWARYRKVEARLRHRLNSSPRDSDTWLALAVASYRQADDDPGLRVTGTVRREAKTAFDKAVQAEPDYPDIRLARAMFSATPGLGNDPVAAIADLTEAIRLTPNDGEAYVRRALVRAVSNEPSQLAAAIDDCETAGRLRPTDTALPGFCDMLRDRHVQAQVAQQQRRAYEEKFAEFEDESWLLLGLVLAGALMANNEGPEICIGEDGVARRAWAKRYDGRCFD